MVVVPYYSLPRPVCVVGLGLGFINFVGMDGLINLNIIDYLFQRFKRRECDVTKNKNPQKLFDNTIASSFFFFSFIIYYTTYKNNFTFWILIKIFYYFVTLRYIYISIYYHNFLLGNLNTL